NKDEEDEEELGTGVVTDTTVVRVRGEGREEPKGLGEVGGGGELDAERVVLRAELLQKEIQLRDSEEKMRRLEEEREEWKKKAEEREATKEGLRKEGRQRGSEIEKDRNTLLDQVREWRSKSRVQESTISGLREEVASGQHRKEQLTKAWREL